MLSCAQDYRKGKDGMQQHIWQATLGGRAVVFTNHPGTAELDGRPSYWTGNGTLPKTVAHKNVAICMHRIPQTNDAVGEWNRWDQEEMLFSHAYFPQDAFDEVVEKNGWVFGRRQDAFVALYSLVPTTWHKPEGSLDAVGVADKPYELVARGLENAWICELGDSDAHSSFETVIEKISQSVIKGDMYLLEYHSPSQGRIVTGWDQSLVVNGEVISVHKYPRFDTAYCYAEFNSTKYDIHHGGHRLVLDFDSHERNLE